MGYKCEELTAYFHFPSNIYLLVKVYVQVFVCVCVWGGGGGGGGQFLIITERQQVALCSSTLAIQSNTTVTGSRAIQQALRRPAFKRGP